MGCDSMERFILPDGSVSREYSGYSELNYFKCPNGGELLYENDETPGFAETDCGFIDPRCYRCCRIENATYCPMHVEVQQYAPCWKIGAEEGVVKS